MVRERKAKPPAAPCWRGGNDAMISARLGTWKVPIPKPTRARAAPTRGSVVEAPQRPTRNSPAASAVSPISIGPHGPQRSVARPASGAARAVATGVSMKRNPPAGRRGQAALAHEVVRSEEPHGELGEVGEKGEESRVEHGPAQDLSGLDHAPRPPWRRMRRRTPSGEDDEGSGDRYAKQENAAPA